jgi:hypothetical protein
LEAIKASPFWSLRVKLNGRRKMHALNERGSERRIAASALQGAFPGVRAGDQLFLKVSYEKTPYWSYHHFRGGPYWVPKAAEGVAPVGAFTGIVVERLGRERFVKDFGSLLLINDTHPSLMTSDATVQPQLGGEEVLLNVWQEPSLQGISDFTIGGAASTLKFSNGAVYLDFVITDWFGRGRTLTMLSDGSRYKALGVKVGSYYAKLGFVSCDGVRERLVARENAAGAKLVTLYRHDPASLYRLGSMARSKLGFWIDDAADVYEVNDIGLQRDYERKLLDDGPRYEMARLGTEIAYAIMKEKFNLKNVIFSEPSRPGADLHTKDGVVVGESRLARITKALTGEELESQIRRDITQMFWKLKYDLKHSLAERGYAVFSFVGSRASLKSLVIQVLNEKKKGDKPTS